LLHGNSFQVKKATQIAKEKEKEKDIACVVQGNET
jgi:hypothetical protein